MSRKFTVDASKKIDASYHNWVKAAKDEEPVDPRLDQLDELLDKVDEDFEFAMAGIDRLGREGMLDEALKLLNTLSDTLDSAIGIIGGDFESNESIESFVDEFEDIEPVGGAEEYIPEDFEDIEAPVYEE